MKISHVSTWKTACGIATYCDNFVRALDKASIENSIVRLIPSQWKDFLPSDIAAWRQETLDQLRGADIVHIQHEHGLFGYSLGKRFALKRFSSILEGLKIQGTPTVVTFHTEPPPSHKKGLRRLLSDSLSKREWKRYVSHYFNENQSQFHAIVHSMATRKAFARHGFSSKAISIITHPCLAPRNHNISTASAKSKLGYGEGTVLIALFGFLAKYKGHETVIKALQFLPENYHFAIVGGMHPEAKDDYLDNLLQTIPDSLAERIRITGWVDRDSADLYFSAADMCVAPYGGDTLLSGSGAITWGLSSGKPVLASKIEAFSYVNREAECLFMFTPDKPNELAWAISKVATNKALADRLVINARNYCVANSWDSSLSKIFDIYKLLGVEELHLERPTVRIATEAA